MLILLLVLLILAGGYSLVTFLTNYRPLISSTPLVDASTSEAIYMDYHANLSAQADANGNLQTAALTLPKGMKLPQKVRVYVILDVFPVFKKDLLP